LGCNVPHLPITGFGKLLWKKTRGGNVTVGCYSCVVSLALNKCVWGCDILGQR
jgi:hypothetical protein